jgi:hypothetical protein
LTNSETIYLLTTSRMCSRLENLLSLTSPPISKCRVCQLYYGSVVTALEDLGLVPMQRHDIVLSRVALRKAHRRIKRSSCQPNQSFQLPRFFHLHQRGSPVARSIPRSSKQQQRIVPSMSYLYYRSMHNQAASIAFAKDMA